jgi:hypothetical protein
MKDIAIQYQIYLLDHINSLDETQDSIPSNIDITEGFNFERFQYLKNIYSRL